MDQPIIILLFVVLVWIVVFRRLRGAERRSSGASGDLAGRMMRLEAKVDLLMKHAGITYDPHANLPAGVLEAVRAGQKIEAIRLYRQATGVDLTTAKQFVDSLQSPP
jgi:hypothetical protein